VNIQLGSTGWSSALKIVGAVILAAGLAVSGGCAKGSGASQAASVVAGPANPQNPVFGKWHFISIGADTTSGPSGCSTDMEFTSTNWIQTQGGATTNSVVTYIPSPSSVYVVYGDGSHVTYTFPDQNHLVLDSFAPCTYVRVG
jgi:hypothetical protein